MSLHFVFFLSIFNVVNKELSLVVDNTYISGSNWGCFECSRLDAELFLEFLDETELSSFKLVEFENSLR